MKNFSFILLMASLSAASLARAEMIEKKSSDVTILQAWRGPSVAVWTAAPNRLDLSKCGPSNECSDQVEEILKLSGSNQVSPLGSTFVYPRNAASCMLIEVRTVIRDAALLAPAFAGLGFYSSSTSDCGYSYPGTPNEGVLVSKDRLHAVGHVTLKDGSPATVHRFLLMDDCAFGGDTGSLMGHGKNFNVYAQFDQAGMQTRNWDSVASNYRLGCLGFDRANSYQQIRVQSFDRQDELLKK